MKIRTVRKRFQSSDKVIKAVVTRYFSNSLSNAEWWWLDNPSDFKKSLQIVDLSKRHSN